MPSKTRKVVADTVNIDIDSGFFSSSFLQGIIE